MHYTITHDVCTLSNDNADCMLLAGAIQNLYPKP